MPYKIVSLGESEEKIPNQSMPQPSSNEQEGWPDWLKRIAAGTVAQTAEKVGSVPRNILDLLGSLAGYTQEQSLQQKVPIPEIAQQYATPEHMQRLEQLVKEQPRGLAPLGEAVRQALPSQEDIRGTIQNIDKGDYLKPRTESESVIQELGSDIASLIFPMGPFGGATKAKKALKIAGAGNAAKWLSKSLGASEEAQEGIKAGTMLLTSFGLQPSLKNKASELYEFARENTKAGETINAKGVESIMQKAHNQFLKGGLEGPGKDRLQKAVNQIGEQMFSGKMELTDAWQVKKDLSDLINEVGPRSTAGAYASQIQKEFNKALKNSSNKAVSNALTEADKIYTGIKEASKVNDFVIKALKGNKALSGGLLAGALYNPIGAVKTAAGLGAGLGIANAGLILKNFITNPAIGKEYISMIKAATKESAPQVIKFAKRLEGKLEKSQPVTKDQSQRFRIVSV